MSSLSELLSRIYHLPPGELQPCTPESKRPNEMALHDSVMPALQVKRLRQNNIGFRRACFIRHGKAEMEIQVVSGDVGHKVVASYGSGGVTVEHTTELRSGRETKLIPISSVVELHEYVLLVATKQTSNTT